MFRVAQDKRKLCELALRRGVDCSSVLNTLSPALCQTWRETVGEHPAVMSDRLDYVLRAWGKAGPMLVAG